ncbi:hypothetical protein KZ813_17005 [Sphingomonas sp. RHCKR7]|uniref:hypothetical protein n=1 Tax=Sphingomonas folli TaxID=2862497 RepID=UPI001CA4D581|nr:hypothetical protein [Sphingomonas folli]MBW6528544.1 hypothetical protein [Sphingomonas folli]
MEVAVTSPGHTAAWMALRFARDREASFGKLLPVAGESQQSIGRDLTGSATDRIQAGSMPKVPADAPVDTAAKLRAAVEAFKKEASMTPSQRARRDVLKAMKLTEKDLEAMSADERKATEKRIAEEVVFLLRRRGQAVPANLPDTETPIPRSDDWRRPTTDTRAGAMTSAIDAD